MEAPKHILFAAAVVVLDKPTEAANGCLKRPLIETLEEKSPLITEDARLDDQNIGGLGLSAAAADMLAWENSKFSIDASVRIAVNGIQLHVYCQHLEHLLRYCARGTRPPRKHRHRYHGVFAPNHKLRPAVMALAIGNVSKQREATNGGHGNDGCATGGCCDTKPDQKPRSHDTSRIAWAKLMARVGEEFPLECPNCGGDIRLRGDGRQETAHAK